MAVRSGFGFTVLGVSKANNNLAKATAGIQFKTKKGVIKGALIIQRGSMQLVPVDFGNLRASHYSVWSGGGRTDGQFTGADVDELTKLEQQHVQVTTAAKGEVSNSIINPEALVGVSAFYGIYVHEDLEAEHTVGENKFLEKSVARNIPKVVKAMVESF